jgi:hypothetical protein
MEKSTVRDREDEEFGAAGGSGISDDDQIMKQEQQQQDEDEEERTRRVELGRPRTPEPMSLGMTHSLDEEDMAPSSSPRQSVIDELFQRLVTLSTQLESAMNCLHHCKLSTPPRKAPSPSSNPKFPLSNHLFNNPKHLPHPQQNPHPTPTHSPKCSTTGKNPLRANGLLSARNGPPSANVSHLHAKNGIRKNL